MALVSDRLLVRYFSHLMLLRNGRHNIPHFRLSCLLDTAVSEQDIAMNWADEKHFLGMSFINVGPRMDAVRNIVRLQMAEIGGCQLFLVNRANE